jgi:hypothetical protein
MNLTDLFLNARAIGFAVFAAIISPPLVDLASAVSDLRDTAKQVGAQEVFNRYRAS